MSAKENPLISLIVNILVPILILNKGSGYLGSRGSLWALLIALLFPLGYATWDYIFHHHKNYVSLLGLVNACLTGSLAVFHLHGKWFAVKDASLPFCLGAYVLISSFTETPFARSFFMNAQILKVDVLKAALAKKATEGQFDRLLRQGTRFFSLSFFLSGTCNFFLALRIFKKIDPALTSAEQMQILNQQIAHMTWLSFLIIALPLLCFTALFLFWFFKKLTQLTDLTIDELTAN